MTLWGEIEMKIPSLAIALGGLLFASQPALADGCSDLASIKLPNTTVTLAQTYAAGQAISGMTTAPVGATCDGIAWDTTDKTIYQTSTNFDSTSGSFTVLHYSPSNPAGASEKSSRYT